MRTRSPGRSSWSAGGKQSDRERLKSVPSSSKSQSSESSKNDTPVLSWPPSQQPPSDQNPFNMLSRAITERDIMGQFSDNVAVIDWQRDLQLLHHFSTYTALTMSEMESIRRCYQITYPRVGYSSKAVLHGILGVAALHLAHLHLDQRAKWLVISTNHQNRAISGFRLTLPTITPENCDELYTLSSLTTMLRCASLPFPTDPRQPDPIDDTCEVFMLMRGVNEILKTSYVWVMQGPISAMLVPERLGPFIPFESTELLPLDEFGIQEHFDTLKAIALDDSFDPAIRKTLLQSVASLTNCFRQIVVQPPDREPGLLLIWPIRVTPEFIFLIRQRHPAALIFLAHWCIVFHNHANFWWLGDRGQRLVMAIAEQIEPEWRDYLHWPIEYVSDDTNIGKAGVV
ncbi:hypothetical protein SLS56_002939 [Neofusicoccum ribis]|uniref:C6 zinc finger domain-containing protein n=1 Tax=Neofusicoccum ribis TaxID=45134 RepID=A0ABR3T163_9PEZI